jgi:hypothetical protein
MSTDISKEHVTTVFRVYEAKKKELKAGTKQSNHLVGILIVQEPDIG